MGIEREANFPRSFSALAGVYTFLGLTRCRAREPAVAEAGLALCERGQGFFPPNATGEQPDEPDKASDALTRIKVRVFREP